MRPGRVRDAAACRVPASVLASVLVMSLHAGLASAQIARLPPAVQQTLAEIGPKWQTDPRTYIPRTFDLFLPILASMPKDEVTVTKDVAYGSDERQRLDVFQPKGGANGAAVVVFFHGGALTAGDKNANPEMYANVLYYFARHGVIGVNGNYRLAPQHPFPAGAQDVGAVVQWVLQNAARLGGDPRRIFLIGHSSGGTHVASWAYDRSIHGARGPSVAGVVLLSARLVANNRKDDPNAPGVEAYFGKDPALYPVRSPLTHGTSSKLPTFIVVAEFDNAFLDVYGAELFSVMCSARARCPRFLRLAGHNHMSMVASFNTADEALGSEILDFMAAGR